jgi:O-antigen/teichoic acid export membrane protein
MNLRQVSGNALSILSSDVMNRLTSFVLYALVARHLGGREFGQLSLALTLFYAFQVFALSGLKPVTIREVATHPTRTSAYFVNGCVLVILSSSLLIALLWGFVRLMHYSAATSFFITFLSLGLIPYSLSTVCEAIFQAWERMQYIAYVNVPANIAKIAGTFLALSRNRGLRSVVLILVSSLIVVALIEIWIVLRQFPARHASVDVHFAIATMRSAITFLGIDGTLAIMSSLNFLLLSKAATEVEVGLYNATTQVITPLLLVYQSVVQSIFPVMCRKVGPDYRSLKRIGEQAMELLLVLALPTVVGLFFMGDRVLWLLYKNPVFIQAVPALRIVTWLLIFQVFTSVLGQVLVASHCERVTLRIVVVDTVFNLTVGWPLIHFWGLNGAAMALLLTRMVDCCQHFIPVSRLFSGIPLTRIVWKAIAAGACMAAYLAASTARSSILTGIYAGFIYGVVLLGITVWACGGYRRFRDRYRPVLSEWSV